MEGGGKKEIGDDERLKVEEGGGGDYCRDRSSAEDGECVLETSAGDQRRIKTAHSQHRV